MIYFDNAATSGVKPQKVINAVNRALKELSANPGRSGYERSVKTAEEVFKVREKVAVFFGASGPENVIFTMNCTHSINCVLKGILRQGDHVVVSSLEHNAVMRPLTKIGTHFDIAKVSFADDAETVAEFRKKLKPNTRLVLCTGASNVTGRALPLGQIGALCRERGILFAVDGAQSAGIMPIDMKNMYIDYLCIAPHKGIYAPMGIGILICEKPIHNTLLEGGTGTNSLEHVQPDTIPEKHESGTVNVPGILGIGAGIDFVKQKGIERIYKHEIGLMQYLYKGLEKLSNVKLYTPYPKERLYAPVLSFNIVGMESNAVAQSLAKNSVAVRGGYHCAPLAHRQLGTLENGTVRISVSAFNNKSEAEQFLRLIGSEKIIKNI